MGDSVVGRSRRWWNVVALVGASVSCQATGDGSGIAQKAGALISDQGHSNGTTGFFFLPPLVPRPGNFGEQALGLWPTVNVDQIGADGSFSQPVATFTETSGPFGERLRRHIAHGPPVDDDGDTDPNGYFVARWKTARFEAPAGSFFRIRVLAGGRQLGFADVQVVGTRAELRNVDRDEFVPLLEDKTLRIKFRIEREAVDRDADGSFDWVDNCPTVPNPNQLDSVGNGIGDACRCPTGADACPPGPRLFALMTTDFQFGPTSLEVVDVTSMTRVHSIDLGDRLVTSLAVSPNGHTAYVGDIAPTQVVSYDTITGSQIGAISVSANDIVLSTDGSMLYAGGFSSVSAIDTATNTVVSQSALSDRTFVLGVSLSSDGSRLAVVTTDGGENPTFLLYDTSSGLDLLHTVPIVGDVEGCDAFPNDVVFAGEGRAILWDSNCDSLYQIDLNAGVQVQAATIDTGRNEASMGSHSSFLYLPSSGRALTPKEFHQVLYLDPAAGSFSVAASVVDSPFALAGAPDGVTVYVSVQHLYVNAGADSLERIDTATSTTTAGVYFFSDATKVVCDMRIATP